MQLEQTLHDEPLQLPKGALISALCEVLDGMLVTCVHGSPALVDSKAHFDRDDVGGELIDTLAKEPAARLQLPGSGEIGFIGGRPVPWGQERQRYRGRGRISGGLGGISRLRDAIVVPRGSILQLLTKYGRSEAMSTHEE